VNEDLNDLMESSLEEIQTYLEGKKILKRYFKEEDNKEEIVLLLKKALVCISTTDNGFDDFYYGFLTIQEKAMLKRLIKKE